MGLFVFKLEIVFLKEECFSETMAENLQTFEVPGTRAGASSKLRR